MTGSVRVRMLLLCGMLAGLAASCAAQAYTPPPPPLTTLPPCPADKNAKKRAKRKDCDPTVYPSETKASKGKQPADAAPSNAPTANGSAAEKFPFPGEQPPPDAAAASAVKKFPFPGEPAAVPPKDPGSAATAGDNASGGQSAANPSAPALGSEDSGSSSSSSGSSSSSSSDDNGTGASGKSSRAKNPDDDDDDAPPKLQDKGSSGRRTLKVVKPQSDDDRVDEDLSIAKFYGQSGNYMGAYLRAKDAVKTEPDYPEGHFALAEAAKKLNRRDEAAAEFQTYLKLSPDGENAKAAEKALADLK